MNHYLLEYYANRFIIQINFSLLSILFIVLRLKVLSVFFLIVLLFLQAIYRWNAFIKRTQVLNSMQNTFKLQFCAHHFCLFYQRYIHRQGVSMNKKESWIRSNFISNDVKDLKLFKNLFFHNESGFKLVKLFLGDVRISRRT